MTNTSTQLEAGDRCTVFRPDQAFQGTVIEVGTSWVRVMDWQRDGTVLFNEWFPIQCDKVEVR